MLVCNLGYIKDIIESILIQLIFKQTENMGHVARLSRVNDYMWLTIIYFYLVFLMDDFVYGFKDWYKNSNSTSIKTLTIISFFLIFPSFHAAYNRSLIGVHILSSSILLVLQIIMQFFRFDDFSLSKIPDRVHELEQLSGNLIWMSVANFIFSLYNFILYNI